MGEVVKIEKYAGEWVYDSRKSTSTRRLLVYPTPYTKKFDRGGAKKGVTEKIKELRLGWGTKDIQ